MHSIHRNFNQEEKTTYWTPIGHILCIFYLLKTTQLLCLVGILSIIYKQKWGPKNSLVIQQLRLCTFIAKGQRSIPGCVIKIPKAMWPKNKQIKKFLMKLKEKQGLEKFKSEVMELSD